MARSGSFTQSVSEFGAPLSYVHPIDNKLPPLIDPLLNDPALKLTDEQKAQLDAQVDDLYNVLRGLREFL